MSIQEHYNTTGEVVLYIFNQVNFKEKHRINQWKGPLKKRTGSVYDVKSLKQLAKKLGFKCSRETIFTDFTNQKIKAKLKELSIKDFSNFYCFVCVILTHGSTGGQLATYDGTVFISKFKNKIHKNKSLDGKPKLFWIQACRGSKKDQGIVNPCNDGFEDVHYSSPSSDEFKDTFSSFSSNQSNCTGSQMDLDSFQEWQLSCPTKSQKKKRNRRIASQSDVLVYYSTCDGYSSSLHATKGSIFIRKLCFNLQKYYHLELSQIIKKVNFDVSNESKKGRKQIPEVTHTLTKDLVFGTFKESDSEQKSSIQEEQMSVECTQSSVDEEIL